MPTLRTIEIRYLQSMTRVALPLLLLCVACGVDDRAPPAEGSSPSANPFTMPTKPVATPVGMPIDPPAEVPIEMPIDPPSVLVSVDTGGSALRCVSGPIDHAGSYYRLDVRALWNVSEVWLAHVRRPEGLEIDEAEVPAIDWKDTVRLDQAVNEFAGFEAAEYWMFLDSGFDGGFATARMGRIDSERESVLGPELREIPLTCFQSVVSMPAHYDADVGACVDPDGKPAMNALPLDFVLATGLGQCATLEGQINGAAFGYPIYRGLDLRGANLQEAGLNFASFHQVRLEGADFSTLSFGYSVVDASIDAYSKLPNERSCPVSEPRDHFRCTQ